MHSIAKAVLEDRQHAARCLELARNDAVDFGERAGKRLLADDLFSGRQCREGLPDMQRRRRADVDNVEIIHAQYFVEGGGNALNGEFGPHCGEPPFVDIAQSEHAKLVGMRAAAFDMRTADAAAGNANRPDAALFSYSHFL